MEDSINTPPKLPGSSAGHARVLDRKNSTLGGPASLTLFGSPEAPQLYADTPDDFSGISLVPKPDELVRFAREVLAFLARDNGVKLPPWQPASDGSGQRRWFLTRRDVTGDQSIPVEDRYHYGDNSNLVRFANAINAQKAADELNKQEKADSADDSTRVLDAIAAILRAEWPGDWASAMRQRDAVIKVLRGTGRTM